MNKLSLPPFSSFSSPPSFDDFIIINQKLIKKWYEQPQVNKWAHTIESALQPIKLSSKSRKKLETFFEVWGEYFQFIGNTNGYSEISSKITEIKNEVMSTSKRSKVIGKVFNYQTGGLELELEDGRFAPIRSNGEVTYPEIELDDKHFPLELIKCFDLQDYRNRKIESLL